MKNKHMQQAIDISLQKMEENCGGPFGAVIIKDGEIIARGWNQVTSTNDPTAHAEMVAIRTACKHLHSFQLEGCEIYTSCYPCPMCLGAIYWARPDKVYYANTAKDAAHIGFDDAFIYEEIKRPPAQRKIPFQQIMREEAFRVFKAWQEKEDKLEY